MPSITSKLLILNIAANQLVGIPEQAGEMRTLKWFHQGSNATDHPTQQRSVLLLKSYLIIVNVDADFIAGLDPAEV